MAVSNQAGQNYDVERIESWKLNELEVRKDYEIKSSNRFAALENLSDSEDINITCENIQQYVKTSAKGSLIL